MALLTRLAVVVGTACCILFIYILFQNLQWIPTTYRVPLSHHLDFSCCSNRSSLGSHDHPVQRQHRVETPVTPSTSKHLHTLASKSRDATKAPGPARPGTPRPRTGSPKKTSRVLITTQPKRPAGPTEPSYIGDVYMSGAAPPQTDCLDGIRTRIKGSPFGGRFLENIPVLQAREHVTAEQYRRLRRYPGAHGWGGVDNTTLLEALTALNSPACRLMLDDWPSRGNRSACSRCAVVGNGGILKGSGRGEEIDAHHYVFRTNGAVTRGFEGDVGSRTTHYTFSTNTLMNSMRSYSKVGYSRPPVSEETRYVFLPDHDRDYLLAKAAATHTLVERGPEKKQDPRKYFGEDVTAEKLKIYHPDFVRYLRNRFLRANALKTKYRNIYRPSTGAVMLLAALHTCDQVSAYGFMTPDYRNYSDHYFDSQFHPVAFFINHDFRLEMALWQQLHKAGLIRLYMHH